MHVNRAVSDFNAKVEGDKASARKSLDVLLP
jgi:hypothetical protein